MLNFLTMNMSIFRVLGVLKPDLSPDLHSAFVKLTANN